MELGRKIYYTRQKNNISQKTLAKNIGVSKNILNKWENCELVPEMKQLKEIAKALDISVSELLDNDIRNLMKENYNDKVQNFTIIDLLKIIGFILLILVLILVFLYLL